ncbi:hypothetical protein H2200_003431 [Cladophialophora chaetospira]|uniref:Fatty acid desaturase domain-containing protein n=1 Tax=Cladophialophora chaetospira TaxID=386627 RepID=A0AA39CLE8_9EURO|nr:hypothetical protein H2200_003431 [Cladophialophora chaetospira]
MDVQTFIDPQLPRADLVVLHNLLEDIAQSKAPKSESVEDLGYVSQSCSDDETSKTVELNGTTPADALHGRDSKDITQLRAYNDPEHEEFEPTVFSSWDLSTVQLPFGLNQRVLYPYIRWARSIARNQNDVIMVTHLILYFTTSVPSAFILLFVRFSYLHGVIHSLVQVWYAGSYTLMMHQHIHMRGILAKEYGWFDHAFPYITDPLHGHTWNSYYHHHVKHHHIEGNGPEDLSSTIRLQRDSVPDFLYYVGRFFFFVWLDLPLYFIKKGKTAMAMKTAFFELSNYAFIYFMARYVNFRASIFVFMIPLLMMRIGLMIGNWGQHAFVDEVDPDSDFRSSITLIDVASNRYCYNDGYHTSHHLNPRRHWRDHPVSFLQQKNIYAKEGALVFRNIDYLMITFKLLAKDYTYLAKCLVPIGNQMGMTIPEIAALLETKTRRFTEAEIQRKFNPKPTSQYLEKL